MGFPLSQLFMSHFTPLLISHKQARGSVRVAKLDAEACKALAQALQIKAFPTVFTFKQGLATDSFVGIPPQEDLQAFFLRAVGAPMGQDGKPVPPRKTSFDSDDPGVRVGVCG